MIGKGEKNSIYGHKKFDGGIGKDEIGKQTVVVSTNLY